MTTAERKAGRARARQIGRNVARLVGTTPYREAGEAIGVSYTWLWRVAQGHVAKPDPVGLAKVARHYGTTIEHLLGEV